MKIKILDVLLLLPTILIPYLVIIVLHSDGGDTSSPYMWLEIVIPYVVAWIGIIIEIIRMFCSRKPVAYFMKLNMLCKLAQIPGYIFLFVLGVGMGLVTIFFGAIGGLFIMLLDVFCIAITGTFAFFCILKGIKQKAFPKTIYGVLFLFGNYIFCIDVVCAILGYKMVKKRQIEQIEN